MSEGPDRLPHRPRVAFVCVRYGEPEKEYLRRQVAAFTRVETRILAWADHRAGGDEALDLVGPRWESNGGSRVVCAIRRRLGLESFAPSAAERDSIARYLDATRPAAIYAHVGFVGMRVLPIARNHGIPLVVHLHGIELQRAQRDRRTAHHLIDTLDASSHVIVVARYMKTWLREHGARTDHVRVIPMGAPIAPETSVPESSRDPRLVAIGRLVPCKGFDRAIEAVADVRDRFPGVRLRIVGDGPERERLEKLAAVLGVERHVAFLGRRPASETREHLDWSDLLIHPASDDPDGPEAFGVAITEAMAAGRPVLATECGGIPDQVVSGESGVLVRQHDRAALSEALFSLLASPERRRRMGTAARARAAACFDATEMAARVEDVLLDAAYARVRPLFAGLAARGV